MDGFETVDLPGTPPRPVRAWTRAAAEARVQELQRVTNPVMVGPLRVDLTWAGGTRVRVWCGVHEGTGRTEDEALSLLVDDAEGAAQDRLAQLPEVIERHRRRAAQAEAAAREAATERDALTATLAGGQTALPGGAL